MMNATMLVERIATTDLVLYEGNPRRGDVDRATLAPVVVDEGAA